MADWIEEADAILICAGAGMSVEQGRNVYVSKEDFKREYPFMGKYGYHTAYDCMGLFGDPKVPIEIKWGFLHRHIGFMRYGAPPHEGYTALLSLLNKANKPFFVHTTNVDGCFERAGFPKDRIYEPQGNYGIFQCREKCSSYTWDAKPIVDALLKVSSKETGAIPSDAVPRCPKCNKVTVFANVRGGNWFVHDPHLEAQKGLIAFLDEIKAKKGRLCVIEIGAGWNTPIVSRYLMEAIVRDFTRSSSQPSTLIRINPTDEQVPADIKALGISRGWDALLDLEAQVGSKKKQLVGGNGQSGNKGEGEMDDEIRWKDILISLRR